MIKNFTRKGAGKKKNTRKLKLQIKLLCRDTVVLIKCLFVCFRVEEVEYFTC